MFEIRSVKNWCPSSKRRLTWVTDQIAEKIELILRRWNRKLDFSYYAKGNLNATQLIMQTTKDAKIS